MCRRIAPGFFGRICGLHTNIIAGFFNICSFGELLAVGYLKAPTHMFAMPALLSVYPDALFVQTHRTPVDAMASVSSLVTILRSAFSDAVDPFTIYREAIQYWSETMDKFLNERDRLANDRICDVEYDQISP